MLFDFSNKKKTKRIAAIICGVLVFAMVVGLLVSAISMYHGRDVNSRLRLNIRR